MLTRIGIVGATGLVGEEILNCMIGLDIKYDNLILFGSKNSSGKLINFKNKAYIIQEVEENSFKDLDYVFFAISNELSKKYYEYAKKYSCIVIDNSSEFRISPEIPLIVPEVNANLLSKQNKLIANPNCVASMVTLALSNISKIFGLERIVITTYQAASGAGKKGIDELHRQATEYMVKNEIWTDNMFGRQYMWNIFSHNSKINLENGYNDEEIKIIDETKKILNDKNIRISVTCVRVPVFRAHSISINLTLKKNVSENVFRETLINTKGIKIIDDRKLNQFPEPINAAGKYPIFVGRIRKDIGQNDGIGYEMFICGDQVLKGAALNAIQILKYIQENN